VRRAWGSGGEPTGGGRGGGRGPHPRRTRNGGRVCKLLKCGRIRVSEGETKADRDAAVAKRVHPDRLGHPASWGRRAIDVHIGDRVAKRPPPVSRHQIPPPPPPSPPPPPP